MNQNVDQGAQEYKSMTRNIVLVIVVSFRWAPDPDLSHYAALFSDFLQGKGSELR